MVPSIVIHRPHALHRAMVLALALAVGLVTAPSAASGDAAGTKTGAAKSKAPASKAPAAKPKAPAPDPNVPEKQFAVMISSGVKVQVSVFPNLRWPGKIVRFDPFVPKTDVNVHSLALNSMWEVYGRQRGSFQPTDATISSRPDLGAIIVYRLKSGSKFCVYPVSSDEKGTTLAALKVWME